MIVMILFCFGVILGSFVNALVWRLRKVETSRSGRVARKYSLLNGRSMCVHCKHVLAAKDLVPVMSWLQLRGRCRYCRKGISIQYPLVELLVGSLFAVFYLGWPLSLSGLYLIWFIYGLIYIVIFVALAVYDAHWFILPDRLVFPLIWLAISQVVISSIWLHSWEALWQPIFSAAIISGLFWGIFQYSRGEWIGGGDVKLALALGLIAGTPLKALLVIFIASLLGTIVSLPGLIRSRVDGWTRHVPFGPYLLAGCYLVVLYADKLIAWYERILL